MFETAVGDGSEKLRLQEKVAEAGRVNTNIAAFLIGVTASHCKIALLGCAVCRCCGGSGPCIIGLKLLVGVVDKIFFGRHFEGGIERARRKRTRTVEGSESEGVTDRLVEGFLLVGMLKRAEKLLCRVQYLLLSRGICLLMSDSEVVL